MTENKKYYRITIVSDKNTWLNQFLPNLKDIWLKQGHTVRWIHNPLEIETGDFAFFLSCSKIVDSEVRQRNKHNLVVHESHLPQGRGWSPLTWQILEGKSEISIALLEAANDVDSGDIYLQDSMRFTGSELIDQLRDVQAKKTIELCLAFVARYPDIVETRSQQIGQPTSYLRRRPKDSELDCNKSISEQFNLLRIVDNQRYPAFFRMNGEVYILRIERILTKGTASK